MPDEIDLLASVKPEVPVRATPPALNWAELRQAEPDAVVAPANSRRRRWYSLAAAAAVVVVIGVVVVVRGSGAPHSAAPTSGPPSSLATSDGPPVLTPRLAALADLAAATPTSGAGEIHYSKTATWTPYPNGEIRDKKTQEAWIAPDTSGELLVTPKSASGPPSGRFPAGQGIQVYPWCWSNDATTVRASAGTKVEALTGANGWMWVLGYCASNGPVAPTAQATILRQLSAEPGIDYQGTSADPVGRSSELFTSTIEMPEPGIYDTTQIYLDPQTGSLLAVSRTTGPKDAVDPTYIYVVESAAMVAELGKRP